MIGVEASSVLCSYWYTKQTSKLWLELRELYFSPCISLLHATVYPLTEDWYETRRVEVTRGCYRAITEHVMV